MSFSGVKFNIKCYVLRGVIQKAAGALGSGSDMSILKSYRLMVEDDQLRCVTTDTALSVIAIVEGVEVVTPGQLLLPADKISAILKAISDDAVITITATAQMRVSIATEETIWELVTDNVDDYPDDIPDPQGVEFQYINRPGLTTGLRAVLPACSNDGLRAHLRVINVTKAKLEATDGIRYHAAAREMPFACQIPTSAVTQLLSFLRTAAEEELGLALNEGTLLFRVDGDVLMANSVTMKFPAVTGLISMAEKNEANITLPRDALLNAIQRVRINADDDTHQVTITFSADDGIMVSASNRLEELAEHHMDVDWDGDTIQVTLNADHVLSALNVHASPTVVVTVGQGDSPVAFIGDPDKTTLLRQLKTS